jgi:hypothetical protein
LKLFPEWGGVKENDGLGEFKYDALEELLYMPQYTHSKKLLRK